MGHDVVGVDRHDDAAEAVAGQSPHVFLGPQSTVGANHGLNPLAGRIADHGAEIAVNHRLPAHEQQITNMVANSDVDDVLGLFQGHRTALLGVKLTARKTAETAVGIANIGDRELEVAGAAMIEHLANQFKNRDLRSRHRHRKIILGPQPIGDRGR